MTQDRDYTPLAAVKMTVTKAEIEAARKTEATPASDPRLEDWERLQQEMRRFGCIPKHLNHQAFTAIPALVAMVRERDEEIDLVRGDNGDQMRMLDAIAQRLGLDHDEGLEAAAPYIARIDEAEARATAAEARVAVLEKALDGMVKCYDPAALTNPPASHFVRKRLDVARAALGRAET